MRAGRPWHPYAGLPCAAATPAPPRCSNGSQVCTRHSPSQPFSSPCLRRKAHVSSYLPTSTPLPAWEGVVGKGADFRRRGWITAVCAGGGPRHPRSAPTSKAHVRPSPDPEPTCPQGISLATIQEQHSSGAKQGRGQAPSWPHHMMPRPGILAHLLGRKRRAGACWRLCRAARRGRLVTPVPVPTLLGIAGRCEARQGRDMARRIGKTQVGPRGRARVSAPVHANTAIHRPPPPLSSCRVHLHPPGSTWREYSTP